LPDRVVTALAVVTLAALGSAALGCRAQPAPERPAAYRPFYPAPAATTTDARGTLKGDYDWARSSTTRDEALTRWRAFLQKHLPPNGEYEDGFQRNYVRAAQYELMRLEYLLGHDKEGDALLQQLEDVRGQ